MNVTEKWLEEHFAEADAFTFYRDMFAVGELDEAGAFTKGKYTGIIVGVSQDQNEDGKPKIFRWTLTDELDAVRIAADSGCFCLCSPISYAGKQRTAENARMLYAFVVDVDKVKVRRVDNNPVGIRSLWEAQVEKVRYLPKPTYIVSSGTGIHLYYVLEHPIPLYRDVVRELQTFKHELTRMVWNDAVCDIHSAKEVQYEGIYQGFRMVGTLTKVGGRARAFVTGGKVTMEYLNGFIMNDKYRVKNYTYERRGGLTLEEAKKKYPEWYERRVLNNEPRGRWHVNRALYEWWRERIREGATVGHRYYCLMTLAIYAQKCSYYDEKKNPQPVTLDELTRDMFDLLDVFEDMTQDEHNHFTRADVLDALEAFEDKWTVYPRAAIEFKSGITIPVTKRNGRTQAEHIKIMNFIRDEINGNKNWREGNGRPSMHLKVLTWQIENPTGTKAECARALGLSKPTVYRHWWEGGIK